MHCVFEEEKLIVPKDEAIDVKLSGRPVFRKEDFEWKSPCLNESLRFVTLEHSPYFAISGGVLSLSEHEMTPGVPQVYSSCRQR